LFAQVLRFFLNRRTSNKVATQKMICNNDKRLRIFPSIAWLASKGICQSRKIKAQNYVEIVQKRTVPAKRFGDRPK
jgi:hypothetical protein